MATVENSIEGKVNSPNNEHNASFYVEQATGVTWVEVRFTDHLGDEFVAREFILETADANAVDFSFDPRNLATAADRVVHGTVQGTARITLRKKNASSIRVKQNSVAGTLRIFAWR